MGVEITPDVEESTEPPICPFTEISPQSNVTNHLNPKACAIDEKSITHTTDTSAPLDPGPSKERPDQNAHLIEPSELAFLLQTDLRYVSNHSVELRQPRGNLIN